MSHKLHVTHVVLSLDAGGLERVVLDLVREGRNLGQRVSVLCLERPGLLAPQAEALGAAVVCAGKRPGLRPGTVRKVRAALRELGPDVVHTHQVGALFYAGPAARGAGVRAVAHTEHGKHYAARLRTRWLGRIAGRFAGRFFCVSRDIAAEVRACRIVPERKVFTVANGIDTARFGGGAGDRLRSELGIPPGAGVIGTVGRLSEVKRQDLLLRSFARLRRHGADCHLVVVGDGPCLPSLRELAAELRIGPFVHFAGFQERREDYLALMDVFALTSRSEGMPLAVLEAWAAGVVVVASAVGGLPEMIADGVNGLLFPSGDEAALADRLASLLADEASRARLGGAGRTKVLAEFDSGGMAARYQGHYHAMLSGAAKPQRLTSR